MIAEAIFIMHAKPAAADDIVRLDLKFKRKPRLTFACGLIADPYGSPRELEAALPKELVDVFAAYADRRFYWSALRRIAILISRAEYRREAVTERFLWPGVLT